MTETEKQHSFGDGGDVSETSNDPDPKSEIPSDAEELWKIDLGDIGMAVDLEVGGS